MVVGMDGVGWVELQERGGVVGWLGWVTGAAWGCVEVG